DILLDQLLALGIARVVLLLGSRSAAITQFVEERSQRRRGQPDVYVRTSIEPSPLGTGGAVKFASKFADGPFLFLNGDTYLDFDAAALTAYHREKKALVTLAASAQQDTARFGRLEVSPDGFVVGFREKMASSGPGLINGGVYVVEPTVLS